MRNRKGLAAWKAVEEANTRDADDRAQLFLKSCVWHELNTRNSWSGIDAMATA